MFDVGILDLDRNLATVQEPRPVHLRQRRRRDGFRVELGEYSVEGLTEILLDHAADLVELARRQAIVSLGKGLHVGRRKHVGTRPDHLAHLDQQPTELGRGAVDLVRVLLVNPV